MCDFTAVTAVDQWEEVWWIYGCFWSKPSVKVEIKTTYEVVSPCEVLWSAQLNTSKVTANRQEDRSNQWEATRSLWGFVSRGGRRPQRSISTTVNGDRSTTHLRNVRRMGLDGRYRHRDTPLMKSSEDRSSRSCERSTILAFALLLSVEFSDIFSSRASQLVVLLFNWLIDCMFQI